MELDYTKPFLDVIHELAQKVKSDPHSIVEQFETLSREDFLPDIYREAFCSRIQQDEGYAGLLSQPSVIFCMLVALSLKGSENVFEGGTGTGYQTAILARLCAHVYTVERDRSRVAEAKKRLDSLGITNVTFIHGDAAYGAPPFAPFDRMIFGAAVHDGVDQHLIDQMATQCRLIIPIGKYDHERGTIVGDLLQCDKKNGVTTQKILPVFHGTLFFTPLISPRRIGWTALPNGYVPSTPLARVRQKLAGKSIFG